MEAGKPVAYSGQGFSLLGEKGRFVLPPDFRKAVRDSGRGERILCLAKHPRWKCLTGFGLGRVDEFEGELNREEGIALERGLDFDRDHRAQQLYGFAKVPFDESGRFVLPERYFKLGALADALFFQGGGKMFTIWNPEELAKMGAGWEDAQEACAELDAQARTGKGRK
ncbi:MAG TPA: division/cell wall cluster transcriptional repressor MraZ [Novosphingobium sp.]|nr:division/cell wall cluster transcriptional repressor MraZ [Novosphingobium sp.]HQA18139.1 division/cell wall cluster transcriptional repressor MraZ [Novosphingobium sp.]